jgi:hypothetical protein
MRIIGSGFRILLLLVMAEVNARDTTTSTAGVVWIDEAPQHAASGNPVLRSRAHLSRDRVSLRPLHQQRANALLASQLQPPHTVCGSGSRRWQLGGLPENVDTGDIRCHFL